eukprot:jgi/Galph1/3909/GphlegSOOS_G2555.1
MNCGTSEEFQYEILENARFIENNQFRTVCLQFPDHLLKDSPYVLEMLQKHTDAQLYILGDTAYAPCCVDVVAAAHVAADAVIHFGHACMSPTRNIARRFVFEKKPLKNFRKLESLLKQTEASYIALLGDSCYRHCLPNLFELLSSSLDNKIMLPVQLMAVEKASKLDTSTHEAEHRSTTNNVYHLGHVTLEIDSSINKTDLAIVWLGCPTSSSFLRAAISLYPYEMMCFGDDSEEWNDQSEYAVISKARQSHVFGVVVSAVAVNGVLDAVNRCEELFTEFQKEWYILNVGKPTPTKLSNFPEIEAFVLIGCPESTFLNSKDYMKPIITFAELELALDMNLYFNDIECIHDFRASLSHPALMTGVSRTKSISEERETNEQIVNSSEGVMSNLSTNRAIISWNIADSKAAEFLRNRTWQGVEEEPNVEPHESKEGLSGIASSYQHET